jgi:uncharacterized membrane protein
MSFLSNFTVQYESLIKFIAEILASSLELIGITIIAFGSTKAIRLILQSIKSKNNVSVVISLGKSLALALEFKMGAEIIKTAIIRDFKELAVLAAVILIRALLAFIIHWEIRLEQKAHQHTVEGKTESKDKKEKE